MEFMWNPYENPYYTDNQHSFIEKNTGKVQILKESCKKMCSLA